MDLRKEEALSKGGEMDEGKRWESEKERYWEHNQITGQTKKKREKGKGH